MTKPRVPLEERLTPSPEAGTDLPDPYFLERWRLITGEPPAILLGTRTEMLALLVESTPQAPLLTRVGPDASDSEVGYDANGGAAQAGSRADYRDA